MVTQVEAVVPREPSWVLDRRNSGNLFWRRDSIGSNERRRVKFRCDVEVREFARCEPDPDEWTSEEEDDDEWQWRREIPPPSGVWGGVCLLIIIAVITYQWLSV